MQPLRDFVQALTRGVESSADEDDLLPLAKSSMKHLIATDGWLPEEFAEASGPSYSQHLLYCDPLERFCVVSFVWRPGQKTPVHDHTVWGVIGQLVGEEESQAYVRNGAGDLVVQGSPEVLRPGQIATVSPRDIDVHVVRNPDAGRKAISIHAYGGNIGRINRSTYDIATGRRSQFVSSYSNTRLPNIWC